MWPKLLDMSKDECKRLLRRTELEAYAGIISAFRAQGDLTKDKKQFLNELTATLSISTERHRAEVRRAVNDEKLSTVAERLGGPNNSSEWSIEGRRLIPLMPRLVPQTVFSLTANQAANAAFSHNLTLPLPSETAKKEASGAENSGAGTKLPSPSSNVVVLPSGLSIPVKAGPDVDIDGPPAKKFRRDSSNSQPKEAGSSSLAAQATRASSSLPPSMLNVSTAKAPRGHVITTNRSLSLPGNKQHAGYSIPASKQYGGKSVMGRSSPASPGTSTAAIKAGLSPAQSPLKFTYTKTTTSAGNTTPTSSAQKVILVSSSSTSFTPSILQRSHSSPSTRPPMVKPGTKQSVILTSVSGQSSMSRQAELVSSGKHAGASPRQYTAGAPSAISRQQATMSGRQLEVSGGHTTPPDTMQVAMAGVVNSGRRSTGNVGATAPMNSTVITARTAASVTSSQMTTYVSTNMAGKPRGKAVSKQKLMKQVNATPTCGTSMPPAGELTASKKLSMHVKQDTEFNTGMRVITQSLGTASSKQQRSSSQSHTIETSQKPSMATAVMATGKPVNVMAGHKVIISTTSAGVVPHHVATATSLIRTKPIGTVGSAGTVGSKMMACGTMNVGGGPKMAPSCTLGSAGVVNPKMVQTIKATTTANVSQNVTSITQIINSKPSLVMHKTFTSGSQAGIPEPAKQPQAQNMASSLLQRPRISMVTGVPTTTAVSAFSSSSIRFPAPQNTTSITATAAKSSGSRRMRSPITMVTGVISSVQRQSVTPTSPNPMQSIVNTGTAAENIPTCKPVKGFPSGLTRSLLGSCSHPNSEWIDYDGSPPDSSASSAIKALLEFRSHPDARKLSQTIDLSHIGTSSATKSVSMPAMPPAQCTMAPSRLSQRALMTTRVTQLTSEMTTVGSQREGVVQYSPALLSSMQSRLKRALMSEQTVKPAAAASFLQTATMEVERALQEQNKALLAKHEGSTKQAGPGSSQAGPSSSQAGHSSSQAGSSSSQARPSSSQAGPGSSQAGPSSSQAGPSSSQAGPSSSQAGPSSSQSGGGSRPSAGISDSAVPKKTRPEKAESLHVTVEDQGVVTERVNLSSEDVSSFVDQFEQFLESEGLEDVLKGVVGGGRGQNQGERTSVSKHTRQPVDSFQLTARTAHPQSTPTEAVGSRDWSAESSNQNAIADLSLPSWRNKPGFETMVTSGQAGAASVVMESGSVDISQMKIEDFTSQRLQDGDDVEEDKQANTTSPETSPVKMTGGSPGAAMSTGSGSGSEELQNVRISSRKRKAPAPIDEEPGPTSMSSWARATFNLLQRVMRFRGANRSKGDLNAASWFTRPVAAAEAPGYNRVIKNPMDFGSVKRRLESGQYDDFAGFHNDMMLVHNNCIQYNPPGHEIRRDCEEVFQFYTTEYDKLIERWERPSPKKPKPDDYHGDRAKPAAARSIVLK